MEVIPAHFQHNPIALPFELDVNPQIPYLLHRAIGASSCGITIADARLPDRPIIYANPAFERITGYPVEEAVGKNCRFLQGADRDQPDLTELRKAILAGKDCLVVLKNYRKDGVPFWNELTISPVLDATGTLTHFIGVQTDITRRKQAEEALQQAHDCLEQKVQERTAQLYHAYDATLEGWVKALDLRDHETKGHTQRVTEMTLRLARAMGMQEGELVHIRRGALLHDIGKIGIPDAILLKPGKLTEDERLRMQKHPEYAFEWLFSIEYLQPALAIPYSHHEKWDGTGYPCGLKGEEIPIAARLFAVVDVWDALRSDRPYRQGWPEKQVMEHIQAQAGTHFDPQVVSVFLRLLAKESRAHLEECKAA